MPTSVIQTSFHAGEWAPSLNARVDLAKYHAGAALLRNFFCDYRGGASTRPGTKYIIRAYKSATAVRLIPFQASFSVSYVLEFGDQYIRFISNGAAALEAAIALTAATAANPGVFTKNAHGLNTGDWVFTSLFAGGTWSTINSKYYIVAAATASTFQLTDLFGVAVSTATLGVWTAGSVARVYTLPSPYLASELATVKFAQNVNTLVLCHANHQPYILTLIAANNWTLVPIIFGSTISAPTGMGAATSGGGILNWSYIVTAVDIKGQESIASAIASQTVLASSYETITVSWTAVSGAQSYNIYRAGPSITGVVPTGSAFGFVSNVTGVSFADTFSNVGFPVIPTDYSQRIPIARNPFQGAGVASTIVTAPGAYTGTAPSVTFGAAPSGGVTATGLAVLGVQGTPAIVGAPGFGGPYSVGQVIAGPNGSFFVVATVGGGPGTPYTSVQPITFPGSNAGAIFSGQAIPANPAPLQGGGTANLVWGVNSNSIIAPGAGYTSAPAITYSSGAAAATAVLGTASSGNPTVPIYFDQRLYLAGPPGSPQQFDASQPGAYYNFNVTDPVQADNAIEGTLVSSKLNTIKSMLGMPTGLIMLSDQQAWLINGGSNSSTPTALDIKANQHAYNGASDVPPILANFDILYVQAKGSIVRDLTYNFYTNIFTGTDISVLSSHLFYGYQVLEWAWAEEPFKVVWCVRSDGTMLTLTFLKEQELIGWAHSDTGITDKFKSVCTVVEAVSFGNVDAVYTCVQRTINGSTVQYIERFAERIFPNGATDAWCVDAGLQYSGAPATTFTGGEHLAAATVTGLADGVVIAPFIMPANGSFVLGTPASKVTVGLAFTPQLQTLAIDVGNPTVQGKVKKIAGVDVRVAETLGLSVGMELTTLVPVKDLVVGNVSSMLTGKVNQTVTGLVTGDAFTILDPTFTVNGQYYITQPNPFPATILGVIPRYEGSA